MPSRKAFHTIALWAMCTLTLVKGFGQNLPFKRGEKLTYRMHYGWWEAGEVVVKLTGWNRRHKWDGGLFL